MTSVDVYPFGDTQADPPPPTVVFAGQCTAIYELYTLGLAAAAHPIKATASWTRIIPVDPEVEPISASEIGEEPPDHFGFSDGMRCPIDRSILEAPPEARPALYLDWLHARMLELARERGWDESVLEQARQGCVDAGLRLHLEAKPKTSPDRRHKATLTLDIDSEGVSIVRLEIRDKAGVMSARTTARGICDVQDFKKTGRQMHWTSDSQVVAEDDDRNSTKLVNYPGIHRVQADLGVFEENEPLVRPDWQEAANAAWFAAGLGVARDSSPPGAEQPSA